MPFGLVLAADFNSTGSAKLPFFQKAAAVVVIVDLTCIKDCLKQRKGAYAFDKI